MLDVLLLTVKLAVLINRLVLQVALSALNRILIETQGVIAAPPCFSFSLTLSH